MLNSREIKIATLVVLNLVRSTDVNIYRESIPFTGTLPRAIGRRIIDPTLRKVHPVVEIPCEFFVLRFGVSHTVLWSKVVLEAN